MSNVAEGNGFIAGRSRETAVELLELAEENEIDPTEIQSRTFPPGYEVPEKLQKAYADKHGAKPTAAEKKAQADAEKKAKQAATAEEKRVKAEADAKEKERLAQEALDEAAEQERLAAEELEQKIADERKADEAAASEAKTDAKPSAK